MNFEEYERLAKRTLSTSNKVGIITQAALGMCSESGEFANIVKKFVFHDHDLDINELRLELGDLLWYVASVCESLGTTLEEIAEMNIEKLQKRYPSGFSAEDSINRKD